MGTLLFRLDDITPDMNWQKFERLCNLFSKYEVYPLLGIVPDNRDAKLQMNEPNIDFWNRIRLLQQQGWAVAMHGYQHIYVNRKGGMLRVNRQSEFAGLGMELQMKKLKQGREILQKEGIHATIFMAPSHSYDRTTLRALKALKFEGVTDGYTNRPYQMEGLYFIPCMVSKPVIPPENAVSTVCYHPNMMSEEEFEELECFLQKHTNICESYQTYVDKILKGEVSVSDWDGKLAGEQVKHQLLRIIKRFAASSALCQLYFQRRVAKNKL